MDKWTTIWDHETAEFGKHSWQFENGNICYSIAVDQLEQDYITVEHAGISRRWVVWVKEYDGKSYKLCGMADWLPELMDSGYWYELIINDTPKITYVGYRTDSAIELKS